MRSYRIPLSAEETSSHRETLANGAGTTAPAADAGENDKATTEPITTTTNPDSSDRRRHNSEETGMALLEGPQPHVGGGETEDDGSIRMGAAVRVLLVDERLLACRGRSPGAMEAAAAAASAVASVETGLFGGPSAEEGASSLAGEGGSAIAAAGHGDRASNSAGATAPGDEVSAPPPLLAGFASLVKESARRRKDVFCSSGLGHLSFPPVSSAAELGGGAQGRVFPPGTTNGGKAVEAGASNGSDATCNGHDAAANGDARGAARGGAAAVSLGSWFSEEELLREEEARGDGDGDQGALDGVYRSSGAATTVAETRETTAALSGSSAAPAPASEGATRKVHVESASQGAGAAAAAAHAGANGDTEAAKNTGADDSSRLAGGITANEQPAQGQSRQAPQTPATAEADEEQEQEKRQQQHDKNKRVSKENGGAGVAEKVEVRFRHMPGAVQGGTDA